MKNLEEIEALHVARVDMDDIFDYIPSDFFITGSRVINSVYSFIHKESFLDPHEKCDFDFCPKDPDNELQIVNFLKDTSYQFNERSHSYYFNMDDRIFNLIKIEDDDPKDILARFDMVHCGIFIGRNNYLMIEDAFHYIKHRTINFNYLSSMWKTIGRIVKYCNRGFHVPSYAVRNFQDHCLEFSKKFKQHSWTGENDIEPNYDFRKGVALQYRKILKTNYNNKLLDMIRKDSRQKTCFIEV